ncbi:hypothetical protein [Dokdonella sp.]|uniref:MSCRAMM family protein n=1 Tax=Dokdonella sp. TaxID=2291710 RepID=UPI001B1D3D23|nr:hypothetical protein [Dokdonella sp.]MBO9663832.1 hypothetical protein [Dokdonella sp.]
MRFFRDAIGIGFGLMLSMAFWAAPLCAAVVTVHGRISDAANGEPIAGALVKIYLKDDEPVALLETTSDGAYAWTGDLNFGQYAHIVASAFGYGWDESYFDASSSSVERNFALFPASVAGVVRDAAGAPLAGVIVQAWIRDEDSSSWTIDDRVATAADGSYKIWLSPGTYRICAGGMLAGLVQECYDGVPVSHLSDIDAATPITIGDGRTRHDVDFDLTAGSSFAGSVADERSGDAIPYADVTFELYDADGNLIDVGKERTDASGAYRVDGVPNGTFRIAARVSSRGLGGKQLYSGIDCAGNDCSPIVAGDAISVVAGDSIDGIDFAFGPEAVIRGRVTDVVDGAPVPNAWIMACYNDTLLFLTYCHFTVRSDADGRYEIAVNVRPYYFVKVIAPVAYVDQVYPGVSCMGRSCNENGESVIVESGDTVDAIDFALRRSSTLAGRVVDSRTGAPLPNTYIVGYDADYAEKWSAYTDQDGRYVGGKWFAGTYYVRAYYGRDAFAQCAFYFDRPCPVYPEPISSIAPTPLVLAAEEHRESIDFVLTDLPIFMNGFEADAAVR